MHVAKKSKPKNRNQKILIVKTTMRAGVAVGLLAYLIDYTSVADPWRTEEDVQVSPLLPAGSSIVN